MAMEVNIKNDSDGTIAKISEDQQLLTRAENISMQHFISGNKGAAFQIVGDVSAASGTQTILHVKNQDSTRSLVITYIRLECVGVTATTAAEGDRVEMGFNRTVASGGTTVTATNLNLRSGSSAVVSCTDNAPTMSGTFTEIDRHYWSGNGDNVAYNKEGTIILGLNDTFEIRNVGTQTGGTYYSRISFVMRDNTNLDI